MEISQPGTLVGPSPWITCFLEHLVSTNPLATRLCGGFKNFGNMFNNAISFNQDLSNWSVYTSTTFYMMFDGADHFNQNLCQWYNNGYVKSSQDFE